VLSSAGFLLMFAAVLFLPAGVGWKRGWLFFFVFITFMSVSSVILWRVNPEIFVARSRIGQGTKSWDKVLLVPILAAFLAIFLVAALDARFGWSTIPVGQVVLGYILFTLGYGLSTWVYTVNKFAEPSVRIQSDRAQKVIDTGPYAIVRHPLYLFSGIMVIGIPLALGSSWALLPVAFGAVVILVRTILEDRTLQRELAGYREYASRVRFRLIPGIW
jgi:protein-S-isoprenylcysteine O-methyltransferase Ste14